MLEGFTDNVEIETPRARDEVGRAAGKYGSGEPLVTGFAATVLADTGGGMREDPCGRALPERGARHIGRGLAGRHHGEILQGACRMLEAPPGARPAGPSRSASGAEREALAAVPCLITMPVPGHGSRACFIGTGEPGIEVRPAWKVKAARAARLTLDFLGEKRAGGLLSVDCPVPVGLGLGSSTSDVVATIRAVCDAHGARIGPRELARLAVAAEGAIDPIMFEPGALFAPREGRVLQRWEGGCPEFLVLSVDTCPGGRGVDTLSLPVPRYGAADLDRYERLICRARMAFRERNAAEMAAVATASAQLNQRRVPMPGFTDLLALAREADGLGVQISHSGTVAGVLFDPAAQRATLSTLARALECIGMHCLGTFATTAAVSVARD